MRLILTLLIFSFLNTPQVSHSKGFGGPGCIYGGFEKTEPPVIVPINGKILIAESMWVKQEQSIWNRLPWKAKKSSTKTILQVYDPVKKTLAETITDPQNIPSKVLSGIAIESGIYLGGEGGLFFSRDLTTWESVAPFKGKTISSLLKFGKDMWVGAEDGLYLFRNGSVVSKHPFSDGMFLSLSAQGNKIIFSRIVGISPPERYCSPYLISPGLEILDTSSGKVTTIDIPGRKREQAVTQILKTDNPEITGIVVSQTYAKGSSYYLNLKTNEVTLSSGTLAQGFIKRWRDTFLPVFSDEELADALGSYYSQQKNFRDYLFWSDIFNSIEETGSHSELKKTYTGTAAEESRRYLLGMLVYNKENSFTKELLTLAVDRKDYFTDDLVRMIDHHKGDEYTALLFRVLRESAPIEPKGIGKNIIEPYPCAAGAAADALLKRLGSAAISPIEEVMTSTTTRPITKKSLEKRVSNWVLTNEKRYYQPPSVRKAGEATGASAMTLLDDPDPRVRLQALQSLGSNPDRIPFAKLVSLLQDDPDISVSAVRFIGATHNQEAPNALLMAVDNKTPGVREWAMIELGKRRYPKAFSRILSGLEDTNREVRAGAAKALGMFKDSRAVPALVTAAKKRGPENSYSTMDALIALAQIGDEPRGLPVILDALKANENYIRSSAAEALGIMRAKSAVPSLITALKDPDASVRYKAATALGEIGDPSAIPTLKAIQDPDQSVHFAILGAIRRLQRFTAK